MIRVFIISMLMVIPSICVAQDAAPADSQSTAVAADACTAFSR